MNIMSSLRILRVALIAGAVGVGATLLVGSYFVGPPAKILSAKEVDGVAYEDGFIELLVSYQLARQCPTRTDRGLVIDVIDPEYPDHKIPYVVPIPSGGIVVPTGTTRYIVRFPTPKGMKPGLYKYMSRTAYECNAFSSVWEQLFGAFITQTPGVAVRITETQEHVGP